MKLLIIVFLLFFTGTRAFTQDSFIIDSMIAVYPTQSAEEKIFTLKEICYQLHTSQTDSAIYYGKLAETEAFKLGDSTLIADVWNDMSIAYYYKGDNDESLRLNKNALRIRTKADDKIGMAGSLMKMGNAYYEQGFYSESLDANLRAIKIYEDLGALANAARLYNNVGNIYERTGDLDGAKKYFERSYKFIKENNLPPYQQVTSLTNLAMLARKQKEYSNSESYYLQAEKLCEENDLQEIQCAVYQGMGVLYADQNRNKLSLEYYRKAERIFIEMGSDSGLALIRTNIAYKFLEMNQLDSAEFYFQSGLDYAYKTKSLYNIRHAIEGLARFESFRGNNEKADDYWMIFTEYQDSLFNSEMSQNVAEMRTVYETDKAEQERDLKAAEAKQKTYWLYILGLIGLLLILVLIFFLNRRKTEKISAQLKKTEELEQERNRIARDLHDHLGAELTLISSRLDIKSFSMENEADKNELEELSAMTKDASQQLRETIWSINKNSITLGELHDKINDYAERLLTTQLDVNYISTIENHNHVLSPNEALNLYRILQEMMHNSLKYSKAQEWKLELSATQIKFSDNGIGFEKDKVSQGFGLQNLHARAGEIAYTVRKTDASVGTNYLIAKA